MRVRVLLLLASAVLLLPAVAACGGTGKTVTIPVTQKKVSITTHDQLLVDFGNVDPSAHQSWARRSTTGGRSTTKVLLTYGDEWKSTCKLGTKGCVGHEWAHFAGHQKGSVILRFEWCASGDELNGCRSLDPKKAPPEYDIGVLVL